VPARQIYLAVRELAHARLFRHARWLRLHLISSITDFAHGIRIDSERLEELAEGFDPTNPEELREAMVNGSLIPPKTEGQLAALARLETMLALVEGWVDVVTLEAAATAGRTPSRDGHVAGRRRPAESAFATTARLRPRRCAGRGNVAGRDGCRRQQARDDWAHPIALLPTTSTTRSRSR
jgi:putative hydrolase